MVTGKAKRLIITRHGETDWNANSLIQGHTDVPLNERGRVQAEALAGSLADAGIGRIYSSDLSRAADTAETVKRRLDGVDLVRTPLLRERNWGVVEGKNWREIETELPEEAAGIKSGSPDFAPRGGESKRQAYERITAAVETLAGEYDGVILIVAHGGVCSLMFRYFLGIPIEGRPPFRVENCSISVVDRVESGGWCVDSLNCTHHLKQTEV